MDVCYPFFKELCLYLDHESQGSGDRDAGDGSSNTTPTEEKAVDEADATLRSSHLTNSQGSASTSLNGRDLRHDRHMLPSGAATDVLSYH